MNDNQNWNIVGEQMKSALSDALRTGDFTDLNDLVSQTVTDTLTEAGKHVAESFLYQPEEKNIDPSNTNRAKMQKEQHAQRKRKQEEEHKKRLQQQKAAQMQRKTTQQILKKNQAASSPQKQTTAITTAKFKQVGNVSNVLYQVFGGIGLGASSLIAFFRLFVAFAGGTSLAGWIINFLFMIGFFCMIRYGVNQRNRLSRAKRYIQLCGGRMYGQIENLARDTGRSVRFVIKDLHRMLSLGMFPEGHLDEKKTCFMLNDTIHQQYLDAEKSRIMREQQSANDEKAAVREQTSTPAGTDGNTGKNQMNHAQEVELNTMVAEGMECIRKLRALNDQIPGEVISQKLSRLEHLLKDIFDSVREHPEQMHRMHKMMDYYLPTTLKLVEAYEDFDKVSIPSPEIVAAKAEIERTLDIINQAFSELLGNLFQDAVLDATTDAQVLQTMLAREGLTGNTDFPI